MVEQKTLELLNKLESFISSNYSESLSLILLYAQINYTIAILSPLALIGFLAYVWKRFFIKVDNDWDVLTAPQICFLVTLIPCTILTLASLMVNWSSTFNWIGMFRPEIFFLEKVLK